MGHTHIYVLTTHARMQMWMSGKWVMRVTLSVSDKPEQSGKTRWCCVITDAWICADGAGYLLLVHWWVLGVCLSLCVYRCVCVWGKTPPPGSVYPRRSPEALGPVLQDSTGRIPIIGLSSLFRVFIRGNAFWNMHMCLAVGLLPLHVCRGDNYPFMRPQCPRMESPLCWLAPFALKFIFLTCLHVHCYVCVYIYQSISLWAVSPHQSAQHLPLLLSPSPSLHSSHSFISLAVHTSAQWTEPSCQSCQSLCQEMRSGCSEDIQHLSGTLQIRAPQAGRASVCECICLCVCVGVCVSAWGGYEA